MNIRSKIAALEDQIRKLELLDELMSDPEMAATAKEILLKQADSGLTQRDEGKAHHRSRRRKKNKRGLKRQALEVVRKSTAMLTAREVADELEKSGFAIKAQNKTVAVSKALRSLAEDKEIEAVRGEKDKSAIRYSSLPSLLSTPPPVREMTH